MLPNIVNYKDLGKLKLETVKNKAIFIAPKLYYLETTKGGTSISGINSNKLFSINVINNPFCKFYIVSNLR